MALTPEQFAPPWFEERSASLTFDFYPERKITSIGWSYNCRCSYIGNTGLILEHPVEPKELAHELHLVFMPDQDKINKGSEDSKLRDQLFARAFVDVLKLFNTETIRTNKSFDGEIHYNVPTKLFQQRAQLFTSPDSSIITVKKRDTQWSKTEFIINLPVLLEYKQNQSERFKQSGLMQAAREFEQRLQEQGMPMMINPSIARCDSREPIPCYFFGWRQ